MTAHLLALAMLAQPESCVSRAKLESIARVILPAAERYQLDPVLLGAVVLVETGGRNVVAYKRGRDRAGADVGAFQIHCPGTSERCLARYLDLKQSADRAALILARGRVLCESRGRAPSYCVRGYWARYNPGSRRWSKRLLDCLMRLRRWITKQQKLTS